MPRLALIVSLCLLAGLACADTFELSDPANEMWEEKQPVAEPEPRLDSGLQPAQEPLGDTLCSVDTSNGACTCIDTVNARKLPLTQEACVDRVLQSLKAAKP